MTYRNGGVVSRPMDGGDPRTPMAWQHRDLNMSQHDQRYASEVQRGQRDHTSPTRNGGYPSPSRHSDRYPEMGRGTPGSRRARGQSSDRSERGNRSSRERGERGYSRSQSRERVPRGYSRSQPSPSTTDGTTEDTTETDSHTVEREGSEYQGHPGQMVPGYPMMVGYPMMPAPHMQVPMMMPGTGSIRSVQSVPMLSPPAHTWDGEPCPVHHHHPMVPLAALYGMGGGGVGYAPSMSMAYSVPPSVISGATTVRRARSVAELSQPGAPHGHHYNHSHPPTPADTLEPGDRRSLHASMASLGHSQLSRPAGHRLVMGENGAPSKLPMREQKKVSPIPSKDGKEKGIGCCSGHFVVIWIILGIVTFGVLLGIVLKFTVS